MNKNWVVLFLLICSTSGPAGAAETGRTPGSYPPLLETPQDTEAFHQLKQRLDSGQISPSDYQRLILDLSAGSASRRSPARQIQRPSGPVRAVRRKDVALY